MELRKLVIPAVLVGETYYSVEFSLTNPQTLWFTLSDANEMAYPNTLDTAIFSDGVYTIPELIIGYIRYRITMNLEDLDEGVVFSLSAVDYAN